MYYRPWFTVEIADPLDVFGFVSAPDNSFVEIMGDAFRRPAAAPENVAYHDDLGVMTLAPKFEPQDMSLTGPTTTGGTWKEITARDPAKKLLMQAAAPLNSEWSYSSASDASLPDGTGLWVVLNRSAPHPDCTRAAADVYLRATLNADDGGAYRVVWAWGEGPRVEYAADGSTWTRLGDIPVADAGAGAMGRPGALRLMILNMGGRIGFFSGVGNAVSESALVVPAFTPSGKLSIRGKNLNAAMAHFPVTWEDSGTFTGAERVMQWYNDSTPTVTLDGTDGATGSLATDDPWVKQYQVALTAQDGDVTPYVRSVAVSIPSQQTAPAEEVTWTALTELEGYELTHAFVEDMLTVLREGSITARNTEGQYNTAYGAVAVRVTAGADISVDSVTWTAMWGQVRFIGWLGEETAADTERFTASLSDRVAWELQQPLLADIQMDEGADGPCIYHTVRVLCERAGIANAHMAVYEDLGNPSDAWTCDGTTCDPAAGHIRMGRGTLDQPLWEFTEDMTIWQCLQDIRDKFGFFCGVDAGGLFTFYPWNPWTAREDWAPVQIFSVAPTFTLGAPDLNEFVGELRKRTSLKGVRNSVTLIGLREDDWRPVVSHRLDADSIFGTDPLTGAYRPANFIGRVRGYVDRNARYSDPAATDRMCQMRFNVLRQPRLWYEPLRCHFQNLFPLQYIGIAANRTLPGDDRFYIGGLKEWIQVDDAGTRWDSGMEVNAHIVPYGLTESTTDAQAAYTMNNVVGDDGTPTPYAIADQTVEGQGLAL